MKNYRNALLLGTLGGAVAAWIGKGVKKLLDHRATAAAPPPQPQVNHDRNGRPIAVPFYLRQSNGHGANGLTGPRDLGGRQTVPARPAVSSSGYYHRGDR